MAALGQNHGAGLVTAPPVAPDKAVGLVPVGHVLHRVDGLDLTDLPPAQHRLQGPVELRIPQHMAHHHHPSGFSGLLHQLAALVQIRRDGLLQQKVVALLQSLQRHGHVLAVLGGDDHGVRQPGLGQQLLIRGKAPVLREAVPLPQHGQALRTAVRPGCDAHSLRVELLEGGVCLQAAAAAAADGKCNRCCHRVLPLFPPCGGFPPPVLSIADSAPAVEGDCRKNPPNSGPRAPVRRLPVRTGAGTDP